MSSIPATLGERGARGPNNHIVRIHSHRRWTRRLAGEVHHMQFITTSSITISATPVEPEADWHDRANCLGVDPDLFFPERGASTREAKEVCRGCEVRHDCLEFALQNGEKFGIWGGLSERERRRIRRQRAQVARSTIGA
jgi:WhiB family redox-sensing transcriptional regulator